MLKSKRSFDLYDINKRRWVLKKGDICEGIVKKIDFPDKALVLTDDGTQINVKYAIPGQRVRLRVTKKRASRLEGTLLDIIERSSDEIVDCCPHFGSCGGCIYQSLPYKKQLEIKGGQIKELLDRGGLNYEFEGILQSPAVEGYRNKMELTFGDEYMGGPLALGMHKRGSFYDIVTVSGCRIMSRDMCAVSECVLKHFTELGTKFYHRLRHEGVLRHLLLRQSRATGELLAALVTSSQAGSDPREALMLDELAKKIQSLKLDGKFSGFLHMLNDSVADVVKSEKTTLIYGKHSITETLLGLDFQITPFSFFQTNSAGAEVLYGTAREFVGETNGRRIFDLYSGTGTIAQLLAPVAERVIGVEIVNEAVEAARENARHNGLDNCDFIAGDVLKVIDDIKERPDLIVLDPPREGIHPKALPKIIAYDVPRIVYVSCKPTSLVRDREILEEAGYRMVKARAVDMFPATGGIECVALFSKEAYL